MNTLRLATGFKDKVENIKLKVNIKIKVNIKGKHKIKQNLNAMLK